VKEIPLTQGMVAIVDDADYEALSMFKWYANRSPYTSYAMRKCKKPGGGRGVIKMHRAILSPPDGVKVDHRDGDGLNNMRSNLRCCSTAENGWNQRKKIGSSRFKGVSWKRGCNKWCAQIRDGVKRIHLGLFNNEKSAAIVYDEAAKRYHSDFARTNF
jgi:hypothetical protein